MNQFEQGYLNLLGLSKCIDNRNLSTEEIISREKLLEVCIELVEHTCSNHGRGFVRVHNGYKAPEKLREVSNGFIRR